MKGQSSGIDFNTLSQTNPTLKTIVDAHTSQAKRFTSPLTSFSVFLSYFKGHAISSSSRSRASSSTQRRPPSREDEWDFSEKKLELNYNANKKKLLTFFMEEYAKLGTMVHLPILVRFYKLLNEVFAYKLTQKEASTLTMIQVLEKLEREGGPQRLDTVISLKYDWSEFKSSWAGISFPFYSLFSLEHLFNIYFRHKHPVNRNRIRPKWQESK